MLICPILPCLRVEFKRDLGYNWAFINLIYQIYIIEQKIAERLGCLVRQFHEICHFRRF
jgi:hypothetical protein